MHEDRVGLGWRPELAAGILDALDRIDVLEVIADNYFAAGRRQRRALKALSRQVPVHIHSIALGLAGAEEVATRRLDRVARLVNEVEPESWSEHLAFVRAGGIEIGHLAAPPRTEHSVTAAARNLGKARAIIGSLPQMENIATLIEPPCSTLSEQAWITAIAGASGCGLLLDLHNLHANASNFCFDPLPFLDEIPLARVATIHIAGGQWIAAPDGGGRYLLDDHLHAVTQPVFDLLSELAARAPHALTVILERDGAYPPMPALLEELEHARAALAAGRRRSSLTMQADVERLLARLLTDAALLERFLADPAGVARQEGLSPQEADAVARMPASGLRAAARSYRHKRAASTKRGVRKRLGERIRAVLRLRPRE